MLIYAKFGADPVNTSKVTSSKTKWPVFQPACKHDKRHNSSVGVFCEL